MPTTDTVSTTSTAPTSSVAEPTTEVPTTTTVPSTEFFPTTLPTPSGEVPAPTLEPTGLGDDPTLDALAESCYDGDLAACDTLYQESETGTPYRNYGDTCAGRQQENSGTWCADAFGSAPPSTGTDPVPTTTDTTIPIVTEPLPPTTNTSFPIEPTTVPTVAPATIPPSTDPGVIPPPTLEPTGLGADPALDALAQSCYDGEMSACDDLWRGSEAGSLYRNFADTCAGRQEANSGIWCADAFGATAPTTSPVPGSTVPPSTSPTGIPPATEQPTGLGEDLTLDQLAQSCFDGDMEACDDLFDSAPIGSNYRVYGDTCAGRQQPGTFNYCHVVFPASIRR